MRRRAECPAACILGLFLVHSRSPMRGRCSSSPCTVQLAGRRALPTLPALQSCRSARLPSGLACWVLAALMLKPTPVQRGAQQGRAQPRRHALCGAHHRGHHHLRRSDRGEGGHLLCVSRCSGVTSIGHKRSTSTIGRSRMQGASDRTMMNVPTISTEEQTSAGAGIRQHAALGQ